MIDGAADPGDRPCWQRAQPHLELLDVRPQQLAQ